MNAPLCIDTIPSPPPDTTRFVVVGPSGRSVADYDDWNHAIIAAEDMANELWGGWESATGRMDGPTVLMRGTDSIRVEVVL